MVTQHVAPAAVEVLHLFDTDAVALHQSAVEPFAVTLGMGIGWNRVEPPVDEYAQFGILEPLRVTALVERLPCGLYLLGSGGCYERQHEEEQVYMDMSFVHNIVVFSS